MKKILFLISFLNYINFVYSWGFYAHKLINESAVYTIPKPLFGFYKSYSEYLKEHAVDADKRRYIVADEACKHYLDGDFYEKSVPLDTLPRIYKIAIEKYTEDTVKAHGIVPWNIGFMLNSLTQAFKEKNIARILKISADLGHYVGDCHVPLHATSNYNGQKTKQHGIHGLWESRLPELFQPNYDMFTGLAVYLDNPNLHIWKAYEQSFALVDSVLKTEILATEILGENNKYSYETRGNLLTKVYSQEFCKKYHDLLGNMVENRLRESITLLGSLIYTCWVNAGQPDLENMPIREEEPEKLPSEDEIKKGKMIGREEE